MQGESIKRVGASSADTQREWATQQADVPAPTPVDESSVRHSIFTNADVVAPVLPPGAAVPN